MQFLDAISETTECPGEQRAPHFFPATRCFRTNLLPRADGTPDYTVEMMNRFKGLGLVNRVPEN